MTTWYRTGTVTVTNGSATVTGAGTSWVDAVNVGDAFQAPDGRTYEITGLISATAMTITPAYLGGNASGQAYAIQPTRGVTVSLISAIQGLLGDFTTVRDNAGAGRFADGSSGAPGMRFISDQDTGIRKPATNEIALVGGGLDLLRLANGLASGNAVQSAPEDSTAGKLLKVGAFGLGTVGSPLLDNFNATDTPGGMWRVENPGTANRPPGMGFGVALIVRYNAGAFAQLAMMTTGRVVVRYYTGGVFGDWEELNPAKISNANGTVTRLPDGLQICRHDLNLGAPNQAAGNIFQSGGATWTYPAGFVNNSVAVFGSANSSGHWIAPGAPGASSSFVRVMGATSSGTALTARLTAIGYYK